MYYRTVEDAMRDVRTDYVLRIKGENLKEVKSMVNADEYYGNYLKGEDIKQDVQVKIKAIMPERINDEDKLVVEFHELKKGLVLNKTNKDRIKSKTGTAETDKWVGCLITLTTEQVPYKGEINPAVRVKIEPQA